MKLTIEDKDRCHISCISKIKLEKKVVLSANLEKMKDEVSQ